MKTSERPGYTDVSPEHLAETERAPKRHLGLLAWLRGLGAILLGAALTAPATSGPQFLQVTGSRPRRILTWALAGIVAFGLGAAAWGELWGTGRLDMAMSLALAALMSAPLLLLGWGPLWTWRTMTVGLALCSLLVSETVLWPWPITTVIIYLGVTFMIATLNERRILIGVGIISAIVIVVTGGDRYTEGVAVTLCAVVIITLLIGDSVRVRRAAERDLAEVVSARHEDDAKRAVIDERTRIARELHDVVAHHMSMIAIQAEAAPHKFPELSPEAKENLVLIRDTSREALNEMRKVVGLLRDAEGSADRAPQPTLERVRELVASARRSGMKVRLETEGNPTSLPTAVDVSGYRIIQEGLSNASRHAPGATILVHIRYLPTAVELRLSNPLAMASEPQRRSWWPPRLPRGSRPAPGIGGNGLIGMRERVAIVAGSLVVGPTPDGLFSIVAILPTDGNPVAIDDSLEALEAVNHIKSQPRPMASSGVIEVVEQPRPNLRFRHRRGRPGASDPTPSLTSLPEAVAGVDAPGLRGLRDRLAKRITQTSASPTPPLAVAEPSEPQERHDDPLDTSPTG